MHHVELHLASLSSEEDSLKDVIDGLGSEEAHQESVELGRLDGVHNALLLLVELLSVYS
jgi:hypothetical protein